MDVKVRRPCHLLLLALSSGLSATPVVAQDPAVTRFVTYYQSAYAQGRDLIPAPTAALNIASIATELKLVTVKPISALTGSSFLDANSTVIKLAGVQGCLSTEILDFLGNRASCAMISLAGMTASLEQAKTDAGDAFPCHFVGQSAGRPNVRFAECFFTESDVVQSLSETVIKKGLAFAARDRAGKPIFPEYAKAEDAARLSKAGIWANQYFKHPYGERYRANPTTN
ncbi:thermonuclease family protein [Ensifer sp. LCM 4579]|uniref:thermonuclease family protein n=1 Tax=Ensifer sp. LCM 4579 TaxID=1848292 RepID=UPI0008DA5807|nr:nuclease [Ensifer sp. LCM 4579]OHV80287.1 nuclease [Ensifer sp. LCM 4579]